MNLFQKGDFTLRSGRKSTFKVECDALTKEDWEGIAEMASVILKDQKIRFNSVHGVPSGGLPFAAAMEKYITPGSRCILLCEDVWTTGGSVRRYIEENLKGQPVVCVVFVARGKIEPWCHAVLGMNAELWDK